MHLATLELAGFKSFAKKTRLTLGPGITCIVGPNGSGKSAVADAVRWVLGEQSLKSIRAKRGEDVIFAGSRARARLGMAEASLALADAEAAGLDTPELVLTRTIDRSGESAYLVNGRPVRLQDLAELLASAGFAQKSYTVIPQGTIDAFVTASPQERRQMFEDATGVTPLLLKQQQAERKLEATKAQILRGKDLLRELGPRLRTLQRQAHRARSRAAIEAQLRAAEETDTLLRWHAYDGVLQKLEEKLRAVNGRIAAAAAHLERLRGARAAALPAPERLHGLRRRLDELRANERGLLLALARAETVDERGVDRIAEEITARGKEQEKLGNELAAVRSRLTAARAEQATSERVLAALQDELLKESPAGAPSDRSSAVEKALTAVRTRTASLVARLRAVRLPGELPSLREEADALETAVEALGDALARVAGATAAERLRATVERLRQSAREQEALVQRVTTLQVREAELRERLRSVEERLGILKRQRPPPASDAASVPTPELQARLAGVQRELTAAGTEVTRLEDALLEAHLEQTKTADDERRQRDARHEAEQEHAALAVERAATSARLDDLLRETAERLGSAFVERLKTGAAGAPPAGADQEQLRERIERLRKQLLDIGGIDTTVLEEETIVERRVTELRTQVADLEGARKNLSTAIRELAGHIHDRFATAFRSMNEAFNRSFREIFGGGRASLSLVKPKPIEHAFGDLVEEESERPQPSATARAGGDMVEAQAGAHVHELPAGVEIHVHPPGKKLQSLAQLSGGEKALTSIALLFAILSERASPFVVLDEVDAALDEANSRRFARLLVAAAARTQFIVITHNRATMEAARALYGVTMGDDGVSQLLSIKLEEVPGGAEAARADAHP